MAKKLIYKDANDVEEKLIDLFSISDEEKFNQTLNSYLNSDDWGLIYHLSEKRQNIISWVDFKPESKVLEVGAGCGAITMGLAKKNINLTAIEPMEKRFKALKARCDKYKLKNIDCRMESSEGAVTSGDIFDSVVCIGVLEYAGKFIDSQNPWLTFIEQIYSVTQTNGTLYLAIENKLGLKYWAGLPEDHLNRPFEGIEDYPNYNFLPFSGIQTFSRLELKRLIIKAGYKHVRFYFPLPDYKLTNEIFSEDYLPTIQHGITIGNLLEQSKSNKRTLFNINRVAQNIISNNLFQDFANSFFIVAEK